VRRPYRELLVEFGAVVILTMVIVLVTATMGSCLGMCSPGPEPDRLESLRAQCGISGGVLIEAVASDGDGKQGLFSICIPERAFYCVDVD